MSLDSVNRSGWKFSKIVLLPVAIMVGAAITAKPVDQVPGVGSAGNTDKNPVPKSAPAIDPCRDEALGEMVVANGVRRLVLVAGPGENPNDPKGMLQARRDACRKNLR